VSVGSVGASADDCPGLWVPHSRACRLPTAQDRKIRERLGVTRPTEIKWRTGLLRSGPTR